MLLNRADALDPVNAAALAAPSTDGIYVLGGDQGLAMQVLAASPAETAITAAVRPRGSPWAAPAPERPCSRAA